jgi:hypothetical protein
MSFNATIKLSDNSNGLISKTNIYEHHSIDCDIFVRNVWSLADKTAAELCDENIGFKLQIYINFDLNVFDKEQTDETY